MSGRVELGIGALGAGAMNVHELLGWTARRRHMAVAPNGWTDVGANAGHRIR